MLAVSHAGCQNESAPASPTPSVAADKDREATKDIVAEPPGAESNGLRSDGPVVRFGELIVEGSRNGGELLDVISRNAGLIQDCYTATLATKPDVAGQLGIRFYVKPDGTVPDAILANAKITDRPLQRCLMTTFKGLRFPIMDTADGTRSTIPIFFGTQGVADTKTKAG